MTGIPHESCCVVVERHLPFPPERIWRALTQPHLVEAWLMKADLKPIPGHRFDFHPDWGRVDCEILTAVPNRTLSYTWDSGDLRSVVTWTLTPAGTGTFLRMEQSGFGPDQPRYYGGAKAGWPQFIARLEEILAQMG